MDRWQRSSLVPLIALWLPIRLSAGLAYRREVQKFHTIDAANAPIVRAMNSLDLLLGRTLIVAAAKPQL